MARSILLLPFILCLGCSITPYHLRQVEDKPDDFVTRRPSLVVWGHDSTLALSYNSTYKRCVQVQRNISEEIEDRISQQYRSRVLFASTGALSGIVTSVYGITASKPREEVVAILGLFSTATLGASFGFLTEDERIGFLPSKSLRLNELRSIAQAN